MILDISRDLVCILHLNITVMSRVIYLFNILKSTNVTKFTKPILESPYKIQLDRNFYDPRTAHPLFMDRWIFNLSCLIVRRGESNKMHQGSSFLRNSLIIIKWIWGFFPQNLKLDSPTIRHKRVATFNL